ncbi:MAG: transcriptional regulator NrdR [Kiritimatiellia bacterium]
MKCAACGSEDDKVLESRSVRGGVAIRRRRVCLECGHRFTTYEEVLRDSLMVRKQDGRLEEFSRQKLLNGITRACQKRPVSLQKIEWTVDRIIEQIENDFDLEVPSSDIGERVMRCLAELDQVAYVRFASVYRRFEDVDQFVNEVKRMNDPASPAAAETTSGEADVKNNARGANHA